MTAPTFSELGVSTPVVDALAAREIYHTFAIQAMVAEDALAGRDVLAKSPTGSGKTLAFAVTIIERISRDDLAPAALVLVPTRELAVQVTEEFETLVGARDLRVAAVYGGVATRAQAKTARGAHILVATPGRLTDLMQQGVVNLSAVQIFVLDEADRMLDMGFKPQVDRIVRKLPEERQTMFFSATLDGEVGVLARAYTVGATRHEVENPTSTVEQIEHKFIPVTLDSKLDALVDLLRESDGVSIVFVRTKRGAARLAEKLQKRGLSADAMHGDMTQVARERALDRFEKSKVKTLVATDVAARGIDLDHVTHVINYDPPEDNKAYVHRVGRTGRAGRSGIGVTLVMADQQADVSRMAARLELRDEFEAEGMKTAPPRLVYSSRGRVRGGRKRF
jgi:superfamily II DNA/RNA helicase